MTLHPVYGHEALRKRLGHTAATRRLPQALLFEGPAGVGKQRLALWLAQLLVCEAPGPEEPCGACPKCRMALSLSHPDIHWIVPVELSGRSSDADRQVEEAAEAIGEIVQARRDTSLYGPLSGMAAHPMASVRLVLRRLALTPALGGARVVILGDAERLRPQHGADAAPNALLKILEEPPRDTHFILTASDLTALLPTILSRTVRVRVARVPDSVATEFAQRELGDRVKLSDTMISAAQGRIGRIVASSGAGLAGLPAADRLRQAAGGGPADRLTAALGQPPYEARGAFTEMLDALLERLRAEAAQARDPAPLVAAMERVLDARRLARGNVNPQLLTAVLAEGLAAGTGGRR